MIVDMSLVKSMMSSTYLRYSQVQVIGFENQFAIGEVRQIGDNFFLSEGLENIVQRLVVQRRTLRQ